MWLPPSKEGKRKLIQVGAIATLEGGRTGESGSRHFGEAGLIAMSHHVRDGGGGQADLPVRTASIVASEPCWLLVLPASRYAAFIDLLPGIDEHFANAKVRDRSHGARATRVTSPVRVPQAIQEGLNAKKAQAAASLAHIFAPSTGGAEPQATTAAQSKFGKWQRVQQIRKTAEMRRVTAMTASRPASVI